MEIIKKWTEIKASNVKIEDCFKKLLLFNNKVVFDFEKIQNNFSEFNVYLIMAERGFLGKTTNLKIKALNDWFKNGKMSLFFRNSKEEIDNEALKFFSKATCDADARFLDCEIKKDMLGYYKTKPFIQLHNVYQANKLKGTRENYNNLIYDEINEGLIHFQKLASQKISSIMASTKNQVADYKTKIKADYFWLLGNFKSINHPLIIKLGITHIPSLISELWGFIKYDDGTISKIPLAIIIVNSYTSNQIANFIKNNIEHDWRLALDFFTGEADHTYFNQTYADEINNVLANKLPNHFYNPYFMLFDGTNYLLINKIQMEKRKVRFFVELADKNLWEFWKKRGLKCFTFQKRNVIQEDINYFRELKEDLLEKVYKSQIYYKSMAARVVFLNFLR